MKRVIIYFDMDGLIAKWNKDATIEDTFAPGYFDTIVEPDINAIESIKKVVPVFQDLGIDVFFLSARYDDENNIDAGYNRFELDKRRFLNRHQLNIPALFVSCGESKRKIFDTLSKGDLNILFDDYSKNLFDWEQDSSCLGIKWLNGINGTHGTFKGLTIPAYRMNVDSISNSLIGTVTQIIS